MKNVTIVNESMKQDYEILENIKDSDRSLCEILCTEYKSSTTEIQDHIFEVSDNYIEIYNASLFDMGYVLYANGYTEEVVSEGLCDGKDIIEHLQSAHGQYIRDLLYKNVGKICYNYGIDYVLENKILLPEDNFDELNLDEYDSDSTFDQIDDVIKEGYEEYINSLISDIEDNLTEDETYVGYEPEGIELDDLDCELEEDLSIDIFINNESLTNLESLKSFLKEKILQYYLNN